MSRSIAAAGLAVLLALGASDAAYALPASYSVKCTGKIQDPHYSKGAGGAILKIDITCKGVNLNKVDVRVKGLLSFAADSKKYVTRATSDKKQSVTVNGKATTFYVPDVGKNGGRGNGSWRVTYTFQVTSVPNATVGSETKTVKVSI